MESLKDFHVMVLVDFTGVVFVHLFEVLVSLHHFLPVSSHLHVFKIFGVVCLGLSSVELGNSLLLGVFGFPCFLVFLIDVVFSIPRFLYVLFSGTLLLEEIPHLLVFQILGLVVSNLVLLGFGILSEGSAFALGILVVLVVTFHGSLVVLPSLVVTVGGLLVFSVESVIFKECDPMLLLSTEVFSEESPMLLGDILMFSLKEFSESSQVLVSGGSLLLFSGFTIFVMFDSGVLLLKSKIVVHKISVMVPLLLVVVGLLEGCFPLGNLLGDDVVFSTS